MNKSHEFEIITNKNTSYKVFLNVIKSRSPHLHLDYEIGLVMKGNMDLIYEDKVYNLHEGDFMCVNPYQIHEFRSDENAQLLFVQINPSFFSSIFPQIKNLEFEEPIYKNDGSDVNLYWDIRKNITQLALLNMKAEENYELICAGLLNLLFFDLLTAMPHRYVSNSESTLAHTKAARIRRIADYIEQHLDEKILLSDIASREHLTIPYLSHFFKDNFNMTFGDYTTHLRCERARRMMLTTDLSLFDIAITCGFSDPKYFKQGFQKNYGCSPKEYRQNFSNQKLQLQQSSMLTTQQILSNQTGLVLLEKYINTET